MKGKCPKKGKNDPKKGVFPTFQDILSLFLSGNGLNIKITSLLVFPIKTYIWEKSRLVENAQKEAKMTQKEQK